MATVGAPRFPAAIRRSSRLIIRRSILPGCFTIAGSVVDRIGTRLGHDSVRRHRTAHDLSSGRRRRERPALSAQIDGSLEWLAEHCVRNSNRAGPLQNGQSLASLRFGGCLWHVGGFFLTGDYSLYSRAG